jgi:hypothetical protein
MTGLDVNILHGEEDYNSVHDLISKGSWVVSKGSKFVTGYEDSFDQYVKVYE